MNSLEPLEITSNKVTELETIKEPIITFVTLVCYDRFEKPHKKLDGALAIPYNLDNIKNFGNIEEEILSRRLPKQWGKIELGRICYQISNTLKADEAVVAFITEMKNKKNVQLCIYQESNESNKAKRIRTLETESTTIDTINNLKKNIYENLTSCDIYIQGCLISDDGRHLKLDGDLVTLWARAIFTQMKGVDEKTPPNLPLFDKSKYRYPISKRPSNSNTLLNEDNASTSTADSNLSTIDSTSTMISSTIISNLHSITVHTPKKSPFKSNIYVTKNMTFNNLLMYFLMVHLIKSDLLLNHHWRQIVKLFYLNKL
ncbi:hypothetical protein C2G38_1677440 [Gigaspora rosea]|uniref:Uncharacterized protein n=1 Tax=Gigaspora rosea TaxID=44941 RepID=A0A397UVJ6_9GLOM|nr:hypothetical protein C2G38_1677440 [Gigaspora rosea]